MELDLESWKGIARLEWMSRITQRQRFLVALHSLSRDLSWLNLFAEKAIHTFWCIWSTGVTQPLIRADG
jgi:hypothetical protein